MARRIHEAKISFMLPEESEAVEIPEQKEHFKLPARFGAVPVDEAPLGWELETRRREVKVTKFQHAYPTIRLPFQEVQRVEFGHNDEFVSANQKDPKLGGLFPTGANRLFFGDNLHVMRQLPSNSIDLIYIDPPFFSGRKYNVIFGDKNEVRSFSDIWEGGMPGYLVWLNARLYEMKRLLKPSGSIYVHLDWHAAHYVKVEMDKIFGHDAFLNHIIWTYGLGGSSPRYWPRKHDDLLWYSKIPNGQFFEAIRVPAASQRMKGQKKKAPDYWDIPTINNMARERIGYPTQKPEALLERIILSSCPEGGVVADFFCGGGTTPAVAQRLNRRWLACDQSRIAIAITADRIANVVEQEAGKLFPVPDFTVEHWGIYEAPQLETYSRDKFREFVVKAFGGRPISASPDIHGLRHGVPLYVGEPSRRSRVTKNDVARFAKAVFEQRHGNFGAMLAWNFGRDARVAAAVLAERENQRIDFVRLSLVRLESGAFRDHVVKKHRDYAPLLSFIQPPEVRLRIRRIRPLTFEFDVSESVSLNRQGVIANVQWDFDYRDGKFTSTHGYAYLRDGKTGRPLLVVQYTFPDAGTYILACSVQDDQGGERTVTAEIEAD